MGKSVSSLPFCHLQIQLILPGRKYLSPALHPTHTLHLRDRFPLSAYLSPPGSYLPKEKINSMEPMPSLHKWFFHPYLGKYPFGLVYPSTGTGQEGIRRQSNLPDWLFCVHLWLQAPGVRQSLVSLTGPPERWSRSGTRGTYRTCALRCSDLQAEGPLVPNPDTGRRASGGGALCMPSCTVYVESAMFWNKK